MSHSRPLRERPELLSSYPPSPTPIIVVIEGRAGEARLHVNMPHTKDPFEVLARTLIHVDRMDKGRETENNSSARSTHPAGADLPRPSRDPGRPLPSPQGVSPRAPEARPHTTPRPLGRSEETRKSPPTGGLDLFATPESRMPEAATLGSAAPRAAEQNADGDRAPGRATIRSEDARAAAPATSSARGVRDTSMAAYRALEWSGKLGEQEQTLIDYFLRHRNPEGWTRQELARDVIWKGRPMSINAVCGRVNALLAGPFELLVELDQKKTCTVTGNRVNALDLAVVNNQREGT